MGSSKNGFWGIYPFRFCYISSQCVLEMSKVEKSCTKQKPESFHVEVFDFSFDWPNEVISKLTSFHKPLGGNRSTSQIPTDPEVSHDGLHHRFI